MRGGGLAAGVLPLWVAGLCHTPEVVAATGLAVRAIRPLLSKGRLAAALGPGLRRLSSAPLLDTSGTRWSDSATGRNAPRLGPARPSAGVSLPGATRSEGCASPPSSVRWSGPGGAMRGSRRRCWPGVRATVLVATRWSGAGIDPVPVG
ncbi:MAG: hypothetical protein OHK0022_13880 [Roseiflexaceae bacterium]